MKKSFYVFLSSLLGMSLFLILDRSAVFIYVYLVSTGIVSADFVYERFLFIDSFSLIVSLMGGAWYGTWLGMHWFNKVYEERTHGGFGDYLVKNLWSASKPKNLQTKLSAVKEHLEKDLWQLEDLAKAASAQAVKPVPRVSRAAVKRAPKKLKSLK